MRICEDRFLKFLINGLTRAPVFNLTWLMKMPLKSAGLFLFCSLYLGPDPACYAQQLSLSLNARSAKAQLSWPSSINDPHQGLVFPTYEVQCSDDLVHWQPVGPRLKGIAGRSGPLFALA